MTKAQEIRDYKTANPEATNDNIAEFLKTSRLYVYQTLHKKTETVKRKVKPVRRETLVGEVLAHQRKVWDEEKHLYMQREIKLLGVIDYLESKINGSSV